MFGEIAPRYDFLNHLLSLNIDRYWRWRTVRNVPIARVPIAGGRGADTPADDAANTPAPALLDLATGTGDLAMAFSRATDGRVPIIGADFCREMLELARHKAGDRRNLSFVEADSLRLPFEDDTFQVVTVAFGLRNMSDTDRALREMTRVCRGGGTVAVLEFSLPRWQPFRAIYGWYFRHLLPRIGAWFARDGAAAYRYLPASVGEFPERDALLQRMAAAGLVDTRYRSLTFGVATLYLGRKA